MSSRHELRATFANALGVKNKMTKLASGFAVISICWLCGGCSSSYEKSLEVKDRYPNAEIHLLGNFLNAPDFLVRLEDGTVRRVEFADNGSIVSDEIVFHKK